MNMPLHTSSNNELSRCENDNAQDVIVSTKIIEALPLSKPACKDGGLDASLHFNISSNSKIELIFK